MRRVVATGRTVDEAVTSALVRLGVTRSQANVKVLNEPVNRLFGILRGKDAEVEVTVIATPEEHARDFLGSVLERMGIEADIKTRRVLTDEGLEELLEIVCRESLFPVVIGRHGATLDSLQYLVNMVANHNQEKHVHFRVDAGGYRQRRMEGLQQMAHRALERALRTGRAVALESMPAAERKIVHTYLQDKPEVTTTSEGVDPNRRVVVVPVGAEDLRPLGMSKGRPREGSNRG